MFEYKFERIELSTWSSSPKKEYQELTHQHAKKGWRLVQIFAPSTRGSGSSSYFEIIFEREVTD
ncbi:DUF4177 domain-containing protein [Bacillus solitudinis]|uniref:DUF4177 domain-containing protein n=1 Tax=Bacillus solitudinis TaxID=2014074 RepID=UPI000C23B945|nr:DUF4177 domain-containing protein [Bacillus solitudinis]